MTKYFPLAVALFASACTLNTPDNGQNTIEPVGPEITDETADETLCGPNDLVEETDKLVAIPNSAYLGVTLSGKRYYPFSRSMWIRTYSLGEFEKDAAKHGAATADFWSPPTRSFNVVNSADASVHITAGGQLWPACDANYTGGSDECWFAGTSCLTYRNTNVTNVRVCTAWKIELNVDSMYLYADSRGISRENILVAVSIHETGHTMGLPHRNSTIMNAGVPIPGNGTRTWENVPRFDACQKALLADYIVDDSSEVIYLPEPEECL